MELKTDKNSLVLKCPVGSEALITDFQTEYKIKDCIGYRRFFCNESVEPQLFSTEEDYAYLDLGFLHLSVPIIRMGFLL